MKTPPRSRPFSSRCLLILSVRSFCVFHPHSHFAARLIHVGFNEIEVPTVAEYDASFVISWFATCLFFTYALSSLSASALPVCLSHSLLSAQGVYCGACELGTDFCLLHAAHFCACVYCVGASASPRFRAEWQLHTDAQFCVRWHQPRCVSVLRSNDDRVLRQ